ncbi:MAG: xanthine dehydrogenase family protein molybdopterin-binding subunit [Rhodospirillales bacterium]|nr:xanthine dehydrogenase family protein molybdopterin-binding subunit [Rhodospirillales bacterium]
MSTGIVAPEWIGAPVRRVEDVRLLTGRGEFADDAAPAGALHAVLARSPHAHAEIVTIDTAAARAAPGVRAVLTGADYLADGLGPIPHNVGLNGPPDVAAPLVGPAPRATPHFPMPAHRVRFVGEPVALVVADTLAHAKDAAERIAVTWRALPALVRGAEAVGADAPALWDEAPGNLCAEIALGDAAATVAAFAGAAHVARIDTWAQRVTGVPMEPRTVSAAHDPATGRTTLVTGSGRGVAKVRADLAAILGLDPALVRVRCGDMGGNYGTRNFFYPEYALLAWAARRLGAAVTWRGERSEVFLSDYQGRDLTVTAALALDAAGNFLALRADNISNMGAYAASLVSLQKGAGIMTGVYRIPVAHVRGRGVLTNTVPTTPYRSAGRPEVMFVLERLIDIAAAETGHDRIALRRRNMIRPADQPYANPLGLTYDSGDYPRAMAHSLALADWDGFPARRAAAAREGRLRGIGIANYVEVTSGIPRERTEITVRPDRTVELVIGTMDSGQGHETSFPQLVAAWLGVPVAAIRYVAHDTDRVLAGGGSHSGRSMKLASQIIPRASEAIVARARRIAAVLLEAADADLEFVPGAFRVAGTDRAVDLFAIAAAAERGEGLAEDLRGPLAAVCDESIPVASFPYGAQVCEVEVDPETGAVAVVAMSATDDVGRAINPMILHGQTHGGIAQGLGQALLEDAAYDPASGQMLAGSFMDYALPRAADLPALATALQEVPSPTNPLGVRSGGEGGTTPALASVVNAVVDALAAFGVRHLEMPVTAERVWRAMRGK